MPNRIVPVDTNPDAEGAGTATGASGTLGPLNISANNLGGQSTRGATVYLILSGTAPSSVTLQGGPDGATWFTPKDIWGADIAPGTSSSHFVLGGDYPFLQVSWSGGDGTTSIDAKVSL